MATALAESATSVSAGELSEAQRRRATYATQLRHATRLVRSLPEPFRDIPIIAMSANAMADDAARCRAAGMNDHIAKPIEMETLMRVVQKWGNAALPSSD